MARKKKVLKEIWTVDCETDPFEKDLIPEPFIWGAYNPKHGYHEFEKAEDFMAFITSGAEKIVYAHNGGKFDYVYLAPFMEAFSEPLFISGRLALWEVGKAEFRDSYNILPFPLSNYQKTTINYNKFKKQHRHRHMAEISSYLKDDCVFLHELVHKFRATYGDKLTIASSAMQQWRKIHKIKKYKRTTKHFYEQLAKYYYGGRVECFESGVHKGEFKVIDINSAYPKAMEEDHPTGDDRDITDQLPGKDVQRCFITLRCASRGAFPFRCDKTKKLIFPRDGKVREFNITGWEYLAAQETGHLGPHEIIKVVNFKQSMNFKAYVDHFMSMKIAAKKAGDLARELFAKLFLNSLYGKFAANPEKYKQHIVAKPKYIEALKEAHGYDFSNFFGDWAICEKAADEEDQRYYNVATAASITGYVRAYLWLAINTVKRPMYCDTDSLLCEDTADLKLDKYELGAWDLEAVCKKVSIAGKKLYAFLKMDGTYKTACKGGNLKPQQIEKVAKGRTVVYEPIAPSYSWKRGVRFMKRKFKRTA